LPKEEDGEELGIRNKELGDKEIKKLEKEKDFESPKDSKSDFPFLISQFHNLPIPFSQIRAKMIALQERVKTEPEVINQILKEPEKVSDKAEVVAALLLEIGKLRNGVIE
jgi:hypothetical protein